MSIKAIIPARGGSKGILKKNIVDFAGRPLLAWTIEQAKNARHVDSVYVSSDDDEILEVAKKYGANVIKRPAEISDAKAPSECCLLHALQYMNAPSVVVFLQATSPLRQSRDIDRAIEKFDKEKLDSLFSATPLEDFFIWTVKKTGVISYNYDYEKRKRRQDISGQIVENGSFYIFKPDVLVEHNNRLGGKIGYSLMDSWKLHEIDNLDDLELCEYLFKKKGLDRL